MAGKLVQVDSVTVSGTVSTIEVGGANWDSSFDTYMVTVNALQSNTDGVNVHFRILDSSNNAETSANYDWARKIFKANTSFANGYATNQTLDYFINNTIGTGTGEVANGILHLYNFNNASEYSFYTLEETEREASAGNLQGLMGGGVLTLTAQHRGVQFSLSSGSFIGGTVTIYGVA
tara:strand:- start:19 stop:549 length:531 start_codon:yes stop_codon:yes gene_type:complete